MTKEQALAMLKAKRECIELYTKGNAELCDRNCGECKLNYEKGNMGEQKEALEMAIKSLEQQPCDDCVSRQAVDELCFRFLKPNSDDNCAFYEHFRELPPVIPTRKSGLCWIERFDDTDKWLECPHCHKDSDNAYAYCPNCGASFKEEKRGSENE